MHKPLVTLLIVSLLSTKLFSQDVFKGFDIVSSPHKISNSLYNSIRFMDSRTGDTSIGIVYLGLLRNTPAKLAFKTPFSQQLTGLVNTLTDATAKTGELLFQLERFHFVETYGTRFCYLDADLYAAANGKYKRIATLDTVVLVRANDIKTAIIESTSKVITDFIAYNLLNAGPGAESYSMEDIANIDSVEMQKMPVYQTENYVDGLYLSYESFAKQKPDGHGIVDADRDGNIDNIKTPNGTGKKTRIQPKDLYAVVYKGVPYVATEFGYYKLQKTANNSFLFTGDVKVAAGTGDASNGQSALGLFGAAMASASNQETYIMLINYRNGAFIHLKRIEAANQ